jgi:signal transduction histidine kinase
MDQFMAVVAHDLRNPVSVVRASAQMALRQIERGDREAARQRLRAILEQADRLSNLLEAFLDAAQVAVQRVPLRLERVNLAAIVQAAVERVRATTGEHTGRPLEVELTDNCVGHWDRVRVGRAVGALVENAFLYGDSSAPVRVRMARVGPRACLTVSGGGPGPAAEEHSGLFRLFFRGRLAADVGHPGSGLGLFTARGITRAHGGDVRLAPGGPADAFELELPLPLGEEATD